MRVAKPAADRGAEIPASPAVCDPFGERPELPTAGSELPGIVFDDRGEGRPARSSKPTEHLPDLRRNRAGVSLGVRKRGFIQVRPIPDALLVEFEPSAVKPLAAFAAFYEIVTRAPRRLVLACLGEAGHPDRYEVFDDIVTGLRRLEAAATEPGSRRRRPERIRPAERRIPTASGRQRRMSLEVPASDTSVRLSRPLAAIAADDEWLGQVLGLWGSARSGRRLPSSESLDPLELLNIARGRAHIVEAANSNPAAYRFRLWGTVNSYGDGYANRTLAEMPPGLMRDKAIADYRQVVAAGRPSYHLIRHVEQQFSYSYARLLLPLAQDGRRVDRLIVLINERLLPELEVP